ncbi:hypothetical protein BY996DRAFT_8019003 [Phakopsora pachyrhizi]|nr:hypothetical protein BY996DRAFT_8019003 [Phakopsora pachyrhizi]
MHEMDFSLQLSAPQDKNHFRTVDTAIMPLERMGEQTSQELDNSSDLRSEMQNRFKKVNLDLSRAPLIHESNHLSASCDTEQVLNDEVRGAINGFKNNQRKGKRNNSIAHEALPKNKKNKTFDTELSESVFKHEGNNEGVVIMPHNVITFEDALMELINPEEPLIRSDLFKIYLLRAEKIKENQKKNIVTNVINLIEERYSIIKKEYFYVTDFEVRKFLTVKIYQGLKLNPHLNQRNQSQSFERTFLTEIRAKIEAINFENLVKHFVEVNRLNSFSNLKGNQTFGFQLRRNSYIEKLFLVHSIMVNKIFCGESKDESFIARQKDSIEFYDSVFKKIKVDKSGNSFMSTDTFSKIDEPLRKKIGLDKKIISFNNCSFDLRQNQERAQFRMAWILIELWLAFCRPHLYNQLNHGNIIQSSFKPFLNTLIKINWLIFQ